MGKSLKYLNYTEEDFANDPFFRSWVLAADAESDAFWQIWLEQYPEKRAEVENARWQMLRLSVQEDQIPEERLDAIWQNIQRRKQQLSLKTLSASQKSKSEEKAKILPIFSFQTWQKIAAVFFLVSVSAALYYFLKLEQPSFQTISTSFSQTKTIVLPDQSRVVLNGNSKLTFPRNWSEAADRVVSLSGEAFFTITHTQNNQKFLVKLKDDLQVNVLGTQFVVTQRPAKTQVVLSEGKVKLTREQKQNNNTPNTILHEEIMQPGDVIQVQPKTFVFNKTKVAQPELFAAFTQNKIVFRNSSLAEVARILEDTYGYKVTLAKPGLAAKLFNGSTPTNDMDMLFSAIEDLFGVQVIKNERQITIK